MVPATNALIVGFSNRTRQTPTVRKALTVASNKLERARGTAVTLRRLIQVT